MLTDPHKCLSDGGGASLQDGEAATSSTAQVVTTKVSGSEVGVRELLKLTRCFLQAVQIVEQSSGSVSRGFSVNVFFC